MRTLWKHERSVLKKSLPKKPKARENAVGRARVVRPSHRKILQRRRDVGESARVQNLKRPSYSYIGNNL
jgi:hypothetical protein